MKRSDLWSLLLRVLGTPAWLLLRLLGVRLPLKGSGAALPPAPAPAEAPESPPTPEDPLPPGWTVPREMAEVKPTLAPVTLALGLAGAALGLLVGAWSVVALGALVALFGGGLWAWDAFQESA